MNFEATAEPSLFPGSLRDPGNEAAAEPPKDLLAASLRWLKTVSSTFQDLEFDGLL